MKFFWEPGDIETELEALKGPARHLWVASAYLSEQGLQMIQDLAERLSLSGRQVTIFLSDTFSENHPANLLLRLGEVGQVWIVRSPPFLHAKIVLVHSDRPMVSFGSANLTQGGLERNIEFSALTHLEHNELDEVLAFFKYLQGLAIPVTTEVIDAYEEYVQESPPTPKRTVAREKLATRLKALQANSFSKEAPGNPGRILTAEEVRELTRVDMPRGRLRYGQPVSKPSAAYIVTWLGAEGDVIDPPDQLIGEDTLYLTDQRLEGYSRQVLDLHQAQPDCFPLWVIEQLGSNVYRSLGLATIEEYIAWNGAWRWLLNLSVPCNVFPASAKVVCDKALSTVDPRLREYVANVPIKKHERYSVERVEGSYRQRPSVGRPISRWVAAGPIPEADWIHFTVDKDQGEGLLRQLYPSGELPRSSKLMVRNSINKHSDVILLTEKDLLGVTAERWKRFLDSTLESFLRHNGMID